MISLFAGGPPKRVARGVKWLDQNAPGWVLKVNDETLHLDSKYDCVLGQVFGDFYDAPPIAERFGGRRARWAYRHGFLAAGYGWDADQVLLEVEWAATIRTRRGAEILAA